MLNEMEDTRIWFNMISLRTSSVFTFVFDLVSGVREVSPSSLFHLFCNNNKKRRKLGVASCDPHACSLGMSVVIGPPTTSLFLTFYLIWEEQQLIISTWFSEYESPFPWEWKTSMHSMNGCDSTVYSLQSTHWSRRQCHLIIQSPLWAIYHYYFLFEINYDIMYKILMCIVMTS